MWLLHVTYNVAEVVVEQYRKCRNYFSLVWFFMNKWNILIGGADVDCYLWEKGRVPYSHRSCLCCSVNGRCLGGSLHSSTWESLKQEIKAFKLKALELCPSINPHGAPIQIPMKSSSIPLILVSILQGLLDVTTGFPRSKKGGRGVDRGKS